MQERIDAGRFLGKLAVVLPPRLERLTLQTLLNLPTGVARRLSGAPIRDGKRTLDPRIQLLFRLQRVARIPPLGRLGIEGTRKQYLQLVASLDAPASYAGEIRDETLVLEDRELRLRTYHPDSFRSVLPVIQYMHGGGFVIGDLDTHDSVCRRLSTASRAVVIAVDYRLAPENVFPSSVADCRDVAGAIRSDPDRFMIDPDRLALAGDSAGANLAAVTSPGLSVAAQLLYYPTTYSGARTASRSRFRKGFGLDAESLDWFMGLYSEGADAQSPELSPLYHSAAHLKKSPPTRIVLAGFDPLRDEGLQFAEKLDEAGVVCDLVEREAWTHGYLHMGGFSHVAASIASDGQAIGELLRG